MAILARYTKQPHEVLDYPVDFTDWFEGRTGETIASYTVTAAAGIDIESHRQEGFVVIVLLGGGTTGTSYKITVQITTAVDALVKEVEFVVKVKET